MRGPKLLIQLEYLASVWGRLRCSGSHLSSGRTALMAIKTGGRFTPLEEVDCSLKLLVEYGRPILTIIEFGIPPFGILLESGAQGSKNVGTAVVDIEHMLQHVEII